MSDVHFAYQTWDDYRQGLANKQVLGKLQAAYFGKHSAFDSASFRANSQPVRPQQYRQFSTAYRGFSSTNTSGT